MMIIKKDGKIEDFNIKKVITSIGNAAEDCELFLNESDLKILSKEVETLLVDIRKGNTPTSSYEVIGVISKILKREKFTPILKAYMNFEK